MVLGVAVSSLISAAVLAALPPVPPPSRGIGAPRWIALRDRPYLLITALDGIMAIQFKVLTVAVPLWLLTATAAPRWLLSVLMVTNTVLVIAFQVRAGRGIDSPAAGGRAYRRAGVAFLVSCGLIALAAGLPGWVAALLLVSAVMIHSVGELWHSAAGFELSFALAPPDATGQYIGVFGLGTGLAEAFGPGLLIALCIDWGRPGWFLVGVLFALTGLAAPLAVRWTGRHARQRHDRPWSPSTAR